MAATAPYASRKRASTSAAAITRLLVGQTDKVSATTNAEIHDREGLVVCRGTFDWRIRRIRPA